MLKKHRQFSVFDFMNAAKPYQYMIDCGFGTSRAEFPKNELVKLKTVLGDLTPDQKALAFAIAENCQPELFIETAVRHLGDCQLSVRLGAYNCLLNIPREAISVDDLRRIKEAISQSPERDSMTGFD